MRCLLAVILLLVLSGLKIQTITARDNHLTHIAWNAAGTQVAVGDSIGQIHVYDLSGQRLRTIKALDVPIIALLWYEDDTQSWIAVSGYEDHTIRIYDVEQGAYIQEFTHASSTSITALIWVKDGTQLVSTSIHSDGGPVTIIWDVETGEKLASHSGGDISDLSWNPKNLLISEAGLSAIWMRDDVTLEELGSLRWQELVGEGNGFYPTRLAWHLGGQWLAAGYMNGAVSLWSETTGLVFLSEGFDMSEEPEYATRILDIEFSPDGDRLTTVRSNGEVIVWDWKAKKINEQFKLPNTDVFYYTTLSPDTTYVAFVDEDTNRLVISKVPSS